MSQDFIFKIDPIVGFDLQIPTGGFVFLQY